eukprot:SAG31_NODE_2036_length_6607_cov_5.713430_7_plen_130_part_00
MFNFSVVQRWTMFNFSVRSPVIVGGAAVLTATRALVAGMNFIPGSHREAVSHLTNYEATPSGQAVRPGVGSFFDKYPEWASREAVPVEMKVRDSHGCGISASVTSPMKIRRPVPARSTMVCVSTALATI